jgi:hypothetical protein
VGNPGFPAEANCFFCLIALFGPDNLDHTPLPR